MMIREAMPRHAVEALETEVRSLAAADRQQAPCRRRPPTLRASSTALSRCATRCAAHPGRKPHRRRTAVRDMAQKIDRIAAVAKDPAALEQLEDAIVGLAQRRLPCRLQRRARSLTNEVRALGAKVEQVAGSDILATLEQRISFIADALQSRPQNGPGHAGPGSGGAAPRRKDRAAPDLTRGRSQQPARRSHRQAGRKVDSSDARFSQLETIERGLAELLHADRAPAPTLGAAAAGRSTPSSATSSAPRTRSRPCTARLGMWSTG